MMLSGAPRTVVSRRSVGIAPTRKVLARPIPRASSRAQLPPITDVVKVRIPELQWSIDNVEGKRLSIAIYTHVAAAYGGQLNAESAQEALQLYGSELVTDAQQRPGSHPNIDLLLRVVKEGSSHQLLVDRSQAA